MGLIVELHTENRRPLALRQAAQPDGGAEILFFTGVRYERRIEPPNDGGGTAAPGRRAERAPGKPRRRKA